MSDLKLCGVPEIDRANRLTIQRHRLEMACLDAAEWCIDQAHTSRALNGNYDAEIMWINRSEFLHRVVKANSDPDFEPSAPSVADHQTPAPDAPQGAGAGQ